MYIAEPVYLSTIDEGANTDLDELCECIHPEGVALARGHLHRSPGITRAVEIFSILGDPTRMRVLTALRAGELCVSDLAIAIGVNRSTVSHQLRVLRSHRLVERRREGKTVFYTIADEHVEALLDTACLHAAEDDDKRPGVPA